MNTFSFRTIIATALVSATALSGCGGSDSSDVRTRNSSINDPCIGVYPSSGNSVVTAAITNSDCATALVDVSPRHYQPAVNTRNTNPYADRRDPSATQMDFNHEFKQFVIAHEARDANNVPIEYVQTTGDGKDIATNVYKRSKIVPISSNDQKTACVQPFLERDGKTPAIGFLDNKTTDCEEVKSYQSTLYVGGIDDQRILYKSATWASFAFSIADSNFPVGLGYYAVVGMVNGYPHTKMVITRPSVDSVNVAHYRYLEPSTTFQYSEGDASSTSSSSSTTVAPDTTISTLPPENSTPVEESSTSSSSSTVVTDTSADVDNSANNTDSNVDTNLRNIIDACRQLEGVETTPSIDDWNEGEKISIQISNDCTTPANVTGFIQYSFSHTLTVVHQETNEVVYLYPYRDNQTVQFIGRLYPGEWKLTLRQNVTAQVVDGQDEDFSTAMVIEVDVKENNKNPLIPCTVTDLKLNGNKASLNCDYSNADLAYFATSKLYVKHAFPGSGQLTEISDAYPGWNYATLFYDSSGYKNSLALIICITDCDQFPSEVKAEYTRISPEIISIKQAESQCANLSLNELYAIPFTTVSKQVLTMSPSAFTPDSALYSVDATNSVQINQDRNTDFLFVYQNYDSKNSACMSRYTGLLQSIISVDNLPKSKNEPTAEPTQVSPPARINEIEISRTDTIGTPVVISRDQTLIHIPVNAMPDLTTADGKVIATASVLNAKDEWVPLLPQLPNNVRIAAGAKELKVKYTFSDGTESIVTKKVESPSVYESQIAATTKSSSSLLVILTVLALLLLVSAIVVIRKRK